MGQLLETGAQGGSAKRVKGILSGGKGRMLVLIPDLGRKVVSLCKPIFPCPDLIPSWGPLPGSPRGSRLEFFRQWGALFSFLL